MSVRATPESRHSCSPGGLSNIDVIKQHFSNINNSNQVISLTALEALGVDKGDKDACNTMKRVVEQVLPTSSIIPSPRDPGIFYVFNLQNYEGDEKKSVMKDIKEALNTKLQEAVKNEKIPEPVAVFKMGSKRAMLELTFRKIAHYLNLGEYAIPGVFSVVKNPDLTQWYKEEVCEDLWSEKIKVYDGNNKGLQEAHVVGILEPFLKQKSTSNEESKDRFANLIVLALATGLRDVRIDNFLSQFFDNEEYMPNRLDPPENVDKACAATHLPCLDNPFTNEPIRRRVFDRIESIVSSWDLEGLLGKIKELEVLFFDKNCENPSFSQEKSPNFNRLLSDSSDDGDDIVFEDEDNSCEDEAEVDVFCNESYRSSLGDVRIKDQGGFEVTIEAPLDDMISSELLYTPKDIEREPFVFNEDQLNTFKERLQRIKAVFANNSSLKPIDIVAEVDPFYIKQVGVENAVAKILMVRGLADTPFRYVSPKARTRSSLGTSSADSERSPFLLAGRSPFPFGPSTPELVAQLSSESGRLPSLAEGSSPPVFE